MSALVKYFGNLSDAANATGSVLSALTGLEPERRNSMANDIQVHKSMLVESGISASQTPSLYCYIKVFKSDITPLDYNSGKSLLGIADEYYQRARAQLTDLRAQTDEWGDALMEDAAIETASQMLGLLQQANYTPPELSWHGGDAVVMLWSAGDMTYAITVTEGEWGYVARKGLKQLRMVDSLKVDRIALKDMR